MDTLNQAKNLIERAQNILILPAPDSQGDSLGGALALLSTLKKLGKNANILTEKIPEKFQFLTDFQPAPSRDFAISIDTSGKEIAEMRYEKNKNDLKIYFALEQGEISKKDVSFLSDGQNPDLVITLGIKSLAELGYYEAAVLNIDNQPLNENFGEVNLIEMTSSLAEILTNLIKLMDPEEKTLFDENIATCLLTGVIYASQNFRNPRTRPKTFETSAFLIKKGANHQKIVQHLYKQKNVFQIKLLGRILEKLDFDEEKELYSASLTKTDFQECQASSRDLGFVIEEIKFNFRYLPNLLILWESRASSTLVRGIFYSAKLDLIKKILENFEGTSKREGALFLIRTNDLNSAKEKVLKIL